MPVQVARRRANSRCASRLGRREKRGRTVNFNDELAGRLLAMVWVIALLDRETYPYGRLDGRGVVDHARRRIAGGIVQIRRRPQTRGSKQRIARVGATK